MTDRSQGTNVIKTSRVIKLLVIALTFFYKMKKKPHPNDSDLSPLKSVFLIFN